MTPVEMPYDQPLFSSSSVCSFWQDRLQSPYLRSSEVQKLQAQLECDLELDASRLDLGKMPNIENLIKVHGEKAVSQFYTVWMLWCQVQQKAQRNNLSIREENLQKVLAKLKIKTIHLNPSKPLELSIQAANSDVKGKKKWMEDRSLIQELSEHCSLYAVFDGHSDRGMVAEHAVDYLNSYDDEIQSPKAYHLIEPYNFKYAVKELLKEIHSKAPDGGSTATCVVVNKLTNTIQTAVLGDSEVWILERDQQDKITLTPLSYTLDWRDEKEAARGAEYAYRLACKEIEDKEKLIDLEAQKISRIQECIMASDPKKLRMPYPKRGLNLSRSIGDVKYGDSEGSMISQSAKVIERHLLSEGTKDAWLIIGSDGYFDAHKASYGMSIGLMEAFWERSPEEVANTLVADALTCQSVRDNISVIAVKIEKA